MNILLWAWGTLTLWTAPAPAAVGPTLGSPAQIQAIDNATAVSVGGGHVLVLRSDGTVWAWGHNELGQLGSGDTDNRDTPVEVNGLTDVVAVAAGMSSSYAVRRDGTVWGWGGSFVDSGLRIPGQMPRTEPVQISGLDNAIAITATVEALVLESDGTAWQTNGYVQSTDGPAQRPPLQVEGLDNVIAIAQQGQAATLALRNDGTVWTWGDNSAGALGRDAGANSGLTPAPVPGLTDVKAIAVGLIHSLALKNDGTVWAWGDNGSGQLGSGPPTHNSHKTPTLVEGLNGATAIAAGQHVSLALTSDGSVWSWGDNSWAGLGTGSSDPNAHISPTKVPHLTGITSIWAGTYATESFAIGTP